LRIFPANAFAFFQSLKNLRTRFPFAVIVGGTDTIHPAAVSTGSNEGAFPMPHPLPPLPPPRNPKPFQRNKKPHKPLIYGAAGRIRTDDLFITNVSLWQGKTEVLGVFRDLLPDIAISGFQKRGFLAPYFDSVVCLTEVYGSLPEF
jgi:hypothetical protein